MPRTNNPGPWHRGEPDPRSPANTEFMHPHPWLQKYIEELMLHATEGDHLHQRWAREFLKYGHSLPLRERAAFFYEVERVVRTTTVYETSKVMMRTIGPDLEGGAALHSLVQRQAKLVEEMIERVIQAAAIRL